jgi:hypothetical protein
MGVRWQGATSKQDDACGKLQRGPGVHQGACSGAGYFRSAARHLPLIEQFQCFFFRSQADKGLFGCQIMPPLMEMTWPLM